MATPKVFSLFKTKSYEEIFPDVSILGRKVDFFLECSSYDVIVPVKVRGESKLDIFEEAVLKLVAFKSTSVKDMADILCLTPDLVNFIIIRLQEMNLLQENCKDLTEQGKAYLNVDAKVSDENNIEYVHAKVFVLNKTGKLLPYVHKGEFITDTIEELQGSILTVDYGTAGNPIFIKGKVLWQDKSAKKKGMLQSSEIRNGVNRFNRLVSDNVRYDSIEYAPDWAMENTSSDNVLFHMQAVIQEGNVDEILVSDGFILNIDFVTQYIKRFYSDFILTVKERATRNVVKEDLEDNEAGQQDIKTAKYCELKKIMNRINAFPSIFTENEECVSNQDENQMMQVDQKRFLLNCYSAFEWSLFYYVLQHPMSNQMRGIIENQSAYQNGRTILQMAEKIGVYYPEKYEELFCSLDGTRIKRMYKSNSPELRVALSIAIITAASDENSSFRKLFRAQPGLFRVLRNLFREHGDLSHQTITLDIDVSKNKMIYDLLIDFVSFLQPDFGVNDNNLKQERVGSVSQERLNAEVSLSKALGTVYFYYLLPETIRDEWILISPDKVQYPETSEYFDILYRIMQDTLFYALKDIRKNPQLKKNDIVAKLKQKGISSKSFDLVYEGFVSQILLNENATLGANAMVYLYYQGDDRIELLKEKKFVPLIERLSLLRKHGNNVSLSVDTKTLNEIRDDMLVIAKTMGGI